MAFRVIHSSGHRTEFGVDLSAGDRGRHRGADLVIINGVGDRYDALLAALAVAQVGGGAVEDGCGLAG